MEKNEFLIKISESGKRKKKDVIYGVYDNKSDSIFTRVNDFFVDHSSVKIKEKSYFFHMLAVMVDAGIPVVHGLRAFASRTDNERFSRVLSTVAYNSEHGFNLSDAMSRFPDVFSDVEIGVIKSEQQIENRLLYGLYPDFINNQGKDAETDYHSNYRYHKKICQK